MNITQIKTGNFTAGRKNGNATIAPQLVVIHRAEGTELGTIQHFQNPATKASSHYFLCKDGRILQFVAEADTAWTNGNYNAFDKNNAVIVANQAKGINGNLYSITIEIELLPGERMTAAQWSKLPLLVGDICARNKLPIDRQHIVGHYQFDAITRAFCPGFVDNDWARLIAGAAGAAEPATSPMGSPTARYFAETGYSAAVPFFPAFRRLGGVTVCGYPLEAEHADADGITRQLYENVMFELWPNGTVRLGGLGQRYKALKDNH